VAAVRPEIMGLGPIPAMRAVLKAAGMTIEDIDLVEMNEAFAAQVLPCRDEIGIDPEKLNVNGGAIALGHPFGMTGARIMTTLLNNLDSLEGRFGLETMCVAGGMGQAMIVERLH
jgi:acetyl-CoA C-acetyltransferase